MKVIVGLGNPGMRYAQTRHNVGFWVVDQLAETWGVRIEKEKWQSEIGEARIQGEKVILMKPLTYMNLSGQAVRPALDWLKSGVENLLVIYDDLDLAPGQIRLREKGGSGGHNGVKSLIQYLGTENFKRIKVGIGRPLPPMAVVDYVLGRFTSEQEEWVADSVERSVAAVDAWLGLPFPEVMNRFNKRS